MERNDILEAVADIWREILEVERIGVDDDFVAAGGDSLLAVELTVRLESTFPGVAFDELDDVSWMTIRSTVDRIMSVR